MFDAMGSTDAQRVKIVVFLLKGEADCWWVQLKSAYQVTGITIT